MPTAGVTTVPAAVLDALRRAGRGLAWYTRGLVREDAYERYVAHLRATHPDPDHPVPTPRQFWREQADRQDDHPEGRCC
ncbi:YbdD/YjiX family protein [Cellulomonas marina]|uniref:Uncharacterized short protein YbdD, DUF466 family n=1 Tax=Cellulomonas marina TaxID=988821 RepID=A0A1I0XHK8_9CELL|nr:YbdD/YjiX family protein [Cellulomonas marina]SFA99926.1 Uncharacterized short protein YbdD, DUF466 family [Cellulomonas marina]